MHSINRPRLASIRLDLLDNSLLNESLLNDSLVQEPSLG
jgi:hypothetical protein